MASSCVPGSGGRRAGLGRRSSISYLIRFVADLPLRLVYGMRDGVPLKFGYY